MTTVARQYPSDLNPSETGLRGSSRLQYNVSDLEWFSSAREGITSYGIACITHCLSRTYIRGQQACT